MVMLKIIRQLCNTREPALFEQEIESLKDKSVEFLFSPRTRSLLERQEIQLIKHCWWNVDAFVHGFGWCSSLRLLLVWGGFRARLKFCKIGTFPCHSHNVFSILWSIHVHKARISSAAFPAGSYSVTPRLLPYASESGARF